MIRRSTMFLPALLLAAAACSGNESSLLGSDVTDPTVLTSRFIAPASVTLSPATATLEVGKSFTLAGTVLNKEGHSVAPVNTVAMRWASSDTTIAKVSGSGVVVALKPGSVRITALAGSVSASSTISVHSPGEPVPAGGVSTAAPSTPVSNAGSSTSSTGTATTTTTTTTTPSAPTSTPTPAAPSTPSAPTTPVAPATGPGLSGKALLADDFSEYSTTAALLNQISVNVGGTGGAQSALYHDGKNGQLASIDPSVQYNGHPTMKYTQPGGTGATPELWVSLPHTVSTMWLRAKIRFSPGFTTAGTLTNSANAYKLFGWNLAGVDGSGRLEITNTSQYDLYWSANVKNTATAAVPNTDPGNGPSVSSEWTDGNWYDYIIEYSVTSSTTGVARVWVARDGQTPQLVMTRNRTANPGYTMPSVDGICLGLNFNQVRTANQNQALWYGQWEVVDGSAHPDPFGVNGGNN